AIDLAGKRGIGIELIIGPESDAVGEAETAVDDANDFSCHRIDVINPPVPGQIHEPVDEILAAYEILSGKSGIGHIEVTIRTEGEIIGEQERTLAVVIDPLELPSALVDADECSQHGLGNPNQPVPIDCEAIRPSAGPLDDA